MPRPRVLVVDDDASIRRFVALALEELPIDLATAASVQEALALLRDTGPVELLITDQMMPGASGIDLLRALGETPALRGAAHLAMLTAAVDIATTDQLAELGVWRVLRKPVALLELVACVKSALQDHAVVAQVLPERTRAALPEQLRPRRDATDLADVPLPADQAAALERWFGNDRGLFLAYHASCVREFAHDVPRGDAAVAARDAPALRRLAHSLKSVLATLGYHPPATLARHLEDSSAANDWEASVPQWCALRDALDEVRAAGARLSDCKGPIP